MSNSAINYEALSSEREAGVKDDLTNQLRAKTRDIARSDSLKHMILNMVTAENYENAKNTLSGYVEDRTDFPGFQDRARRYVSHGLDLIQAIELKRNFPGLMSLPFAKQQEIHEGVMKHFEELKQTLNSIQKSEREHKLQDLRSTTWFLNTLSYCLFIVVMIGFIVAIKDGLGNSFYIVVESITNDASSFLIELIGL